MYLYIYIHIYKYTHTYICVHIYTYIYIIHIYIHLRISHTCGAASHPPHEVTQHIIKARFGVDDGTLLRETFPAREQVNRQRPHRPDESLLQQVQPYKHRGARVNARYRRYRGSPRSRVNP